MKKKNMFIHHNFSLETLSNLLRVQLAAKKPPTASKW